MNKDEIKMYIDKLKEIAQKTNNTELSFSFLITPAYINKDDFNSNIFENTVEFKIGSLKEVEYLDQSFMIYEVREGSDYDQEKKEFVKNGNIYHELHILPYDAIAGITTTY